MSARTREETAAEFAAEMNAQVYVGDDVIANAGRMDLPEFTLPPADAPLHEHLAFVGHVAEALYPTWQLEGIGNVWRFREPNPLEWRVTFWNWVSVVQSVRCSAADLSSAAMLAAIQAKRGAP